MRSSRPHERPVRGIPAVIRPPCRQPSQAQERPAAVRRVCPYRARRTRISSSYCAATGSAPPSAPELAELGVLERTHCLRVSDEDLPAVYHRAAAFVFPSRYEGYGLPVAEAMASGCPVLAADTPAVTEVADGAALIFGPDDEDGARRLAHPCPRRRCAARATRRRRTATGPRRCRGAAPPSPRPQAYRRVVHGTPLMRGRLRMLAGRRGGAFLAVAVTGFATQLVTALSGPFVARMLGPHGRGQMVLVALIALVCSQLAVGGLPAAIAHTVGASHLPGARRRARAGTAGGSRARCRPRLRGGDRRSRSSSAGRRESGLPLPAPASR